MTAEMIDAKALEDSNQFTLRPSVLSNTSQKKKVKNLMYEIEKY
jgi:hypothetical protein